VRGQEVPARDKSTKDHVEHIRTVHFTLAALCLGLIVIVSSDRTSKVSRALEELNTIQSALLKWIPSEWRVEALAEEGYRSALSENRPMQNPENLGLLVQDAVYVWPARAIGFRSSDKEVAKIGSYGSKKRLAAIQERKNDAHSNSFRIALETRFVYPERCESDHPHELYREPPPVLANPHTVSEFESSWDCLRKANEVDFPVLIASSALLDGKIVPLVRETSPPKNPGPWLLSSHI
jgi:hypothetical protein